MYTCRRALSTKEFLLVLRLLNTKPFDFLSAQKEAEIDTVMNTEWPNYVKDMSWSIAGWLDRLDDYSTALPLPAFTLQFLQNFQVCLLQT